MAVRTAVSSPYAFSVRAVRRSRLLPVTRKHWPADIALAAVATALNVAGSLRPEGDVTYDFRDGGPLLVVLSAVAGLALAVRRIRPLASFLVVAGSVTIVEAQSWQIGWLPVTLAFSGYALGAYGSRRQGLIGLGAALLAMAGLAGEAAAGFESWLAVSAPAELLLAWIFGRVVGYRRRIADEARLQALHLTRTGAVTVERAAQSERLRVARDLHDTVTNQLSIVAIHASAPSSADGAEVVLARIRAGARASMDDLRRLLGALRQGNDAVSDLDRSLARVTGWTPDDRSPRRLPSQLPTDWPMDLALGLAVMVVNLVGSLIPDTHVTPPYREPILWVLGPLAAASGLALILRRRFPVTVLAIVFGVVTMVEVLWWQTGTMPASLLIATYTVGAWAPLRRGAMAMGAMYAASAVVTVCLFVADSPAYAESADPESVIAVGVPWLIGVFIGRKRRAVERALQQAHDAERAQAVAEERAVADERLRVARDLHDVIAHGLAAIAVESAVARRQFGGRDFAVIDAASHAALEALREMLDVLQGTAPDQPAPGLPELEALVATHRAAHGPVALDLDPDVDEESAGLRLTVHRIVQEALANVGRHAPGASAMVTVRRARDNVEVTVEDDGPRLSPAGGAGTGSGFGLVGMRERVEVFGGTLEAGPTGGQGFRVSARLPRGARC